jgi:hypothetical protein
VIHCQIAWTLEWEDTRVKEIDGNWPISPEIGGIDQVRFLEIGRFPPNPAVLAEKLAINSDSAVADCLQHCILDTVDGLLFISD